MFRLLLVLFPGIIPQQYTVYLVMNSPTPSKGRAQLSGQGRALCLVLGWITGIYLCGYCACTAFYFKYPPAFLPS